MAPSVGECRREEMVVGGRLSWQGCVRPTAERAQDAPIPSNSDFPNSQGPGGSWAPGRGGACFHGDSGGISLGS